MVVPAPMQRLRALAQQVGPAPTPTATATTAPDDPYPDPFDYRGKAVAFVPKPDPDSPPAGTGAGAGAGAGAAPVLSPEDHEHFLRTGYIHVRGAIPPGSVEAALAFVDGPQRVTEYPKLDCSRVHGAVQELLGSRYTLNSDPTNGGYDMPRPLVSHDDDEAAYAEALAGSVSETVVTSGGSHCDDAYGTLMPQGWALGSFIFLTPVAPRGGGFIVYPGSFLRYREAMGTVGPGCYKGAAPVHGGELLEVLAEPGDAVIFHHVRAARFLGLRAPVSLTPDITPPADGSQRQR
jgi:hypothetical protein